MSTTGRKINVTPESLHRALEAAHATYIASNPEDRAKSREAVEGASPAEYADAAAPYLFELLEKHSPA